MTAKMLRDHADELIAALEDEPEMARARIVLVANALRNMAEAPRPKPGGRTA